NTCSIRQKAEQKFYSELGKAKAYKKRKPGIKIAVAGCVAQQEGKNILRKAPYVDFIFGPQNIHKLPGLLSRGTSPVVTDDNTEIATTDLPVKRGEGVKAWVTIMYGCNNFCSYCVVPYTRGRERSRPSDNIYSEVVELSERGYREITLLGQNVNSYRSDTDFPGLLRKLDQIRGIERIRFVTSHPRDLSAELISAMADLSKVCEHIHLPLQSGSSKILELMNRGYTYEDYIEKVSNLRRKIPDISITSDIIAGFPGETEDDHMLTLKALREIEFDGIFAFKFSRRPGTRSASISSNLSEEVKSERLSEILKIQDEITTQRNRFLEGTIQEVLIEGESETDKEKLTGRTRTNKIVNIPKIDVERGTLLHVEITKGRPHSLEGEPLDRIQGVKDLKGEKEKVKE
ncbi:MAG: tRNA (N6-isopentenyl adenosine(37)-C2)-methylthiotransferase MiaB, partial [Nitrospirota bacterium]